MPFPIVAATGHRPKDVPPAARPWLREKLQAGAAWLRDVHGTRVGITGMALGVDMWWAQAVLDAGLDLWAYIPFEQQPDPWPPADRAEWRRLLKLAAKVHVVGDLGDLAGERRRREAVRLLHARNDAMFDAATFVVACWTGKQSGGTYSAIVKAERRRLPLSRIDPVRQRVVGPVETILQQPAREVAQ